VFQFPDQLSVYEACRFLGVSWKVSDELGVHYTRDANGGWTVDNSPYITQAKEKFDQYPLPISPNIPMPTDLHVMPTDWDDYTLDTKLLEHYQSNIGVLIWTVSTLRFDVAYHISVLSQYMTRPTEKRVKTAYRVMGYLVDTPHFNICYKTPHTLNYETGYTLRVMQVLQMTDLQGKVSKDT
jgi:hypothetical protein